MEITRQRTRKINIVFKRLMPQKTIEKRCKICNNKFFPKTNSSLYCSKGCILEANKLRKKSRKVEKKCKVCGKTFFATYNNFRKTCSYKCMASIARKSAEKAREVKRKDVRLWKNYKNGRQRERGLHSRRCYDYRKRLEKKHGYLFCEICKTNINGTPRFETHHIVYASEAPKHKYLHDDRNLIVLCTSCHHKFHGNKREIRKKIVIERDLEKLFNRQLYDRN